MENDVKTRGVVYTPPLIVQHIVDSLLVDDLPQDVKLLDPACGDGRFLSYAAEALSRKLGKPISQVVSENIFGFDCDPIAIEKCRAQVGDANLFCGNSIDLDFVSSHFGRYDIVVGNPPYVRGQNLLATDRQHLENWQFTKGNTDLYIAFMELAFRLIKPDGAVGYITPNSFLKNRSQKKFVDWLIQNHLIRSITDFKHYQVFPGVSTYCAILIGDKKPKQFLLASWPTQDGQACDVKNYDGLSADNIAISNAQEKRIQHLKTRGPKLRELARVSVGLATLADHVFFLSEYQEDGDYVVFEKHRIEKAVLKPCVKVGRLKSEQDLKERTRYIIYPYHPDGKPFTEGDLANHPGAYHYLRSQKSVLLHRDKGRLKYDWFLYGRSQGIKTLWGTKLLVPPIAKEPRFIYSDNPDLLFISGYAILNPKGTDLMTIKQNLETEEFKEYLHLLSKDYQGGWKSCAKHMIHDFSFNPDVSDDDHRV